MFIFQDGSDKNSKKRVCRAYKVLNLENRIEKDETILVNFEKNDSTAVAICSCKQDRTANNNVSVRKKSSQTYR